MNLYDELGAQPDWSYDQLREAYRRLAKEHHPDRGGDAERFKRVQNAWDVLGDVEKRERYDRTGEAGSVERVAPETMMVVSMFREAVESTVDTNVDIVIAVRQRLTSMLLKCMHQLPEIEHRVTELLDVASRFTGDDVVHEMFAVQVAAARAAVKEHEKGVDLINRALKLVSTYRYRTDARGPVTGPLTTSTDVLWGWK